MTHFIETMLTAARKRAQYSRTRAELARLPLDSRLDLDIYDIDATARRAVWG
jgi:hypothetical protein